MKFIRTLSLIVIMAMLTITLAGCNPRLTGEDTLTSVLEKDYKVVFEDNFDGNEVDKETWIVGYPENSRGGAYYVEDAVSVRDGNMVITTDYRKDGIEGEGWYTGWVESSDSTSYIMNKVNPHVSDNHKGFSAKRGYFEARLKLPKGVGMWAAFWLMPCNHADGMTWHDDVLDTATDGVEIDIMESFNYGKFGNKNLNTHVVHMDGYGESIKSIKSPLINIGEDLYNEFHTYGVMWTEDEYIFYIDRKESWRTDGTYNGKKMGISDVNECILLTAEVPGIDTKHPGRVKNEKGKLVKHWSGDVMKNDLDKKYEFFIDYVRVYQK